MLKQYQQHVAKSFTLKMSQVMKDFTLHERVPLAVPEVAEKEERLVQKGLIKSGEHYGKRQDNEEES